MARCQLDDVCIFLANDKYVVSRWGYKHFPSFSFCANWGSDLKRSADFYFFLMRRLEVLQLYLCFWWILWWKLMFKLLRREKKKCRENLSVVLSNNWRVGGSNPRSLCLYQQLWSKVHRHMFLILPCAASPDVCRYVINCEHQRICPFQNYATSFLVLAAGGSAIHH